MNTIFCPLASYWNKVPMSNLTLWFGSLIEEWQQATLMDYAHLVLAVVVLGWFIARFSSR